MERNTLTLSGPSVTRTGGEVALAHGALAEVVQLRIEYRYEADAALDAELPELLSTLESRPLRKSQIIFRR